MYGLEKIVNILGPMILGIALARAFLKPLQNEALSNKQKLATMFDTAALKILLPFFIVDSIMKSTITSDFLYVLFLGFCIPALVYVTWIVFEPLAKRIQIPFFLELSFLSSTFGGGNRGNLFIMLLFATSTNYNALLTYFSWVDLGNLIFLFTIMPWLLRNKYRKKPVDERNKIEPGEDNNRIRRRLGRILTVVKKIGFSYPVISFIWVLGYLISNHVSFVEKSQLDAFLKQSVDIRKYLFMSLLFGSIYLRMDLNVENMKRFLPDFLSLGFSRVLVIILISGIIYFMKLDALLLKACVILLLMPPSSILPSMISEEISDNKVNTYVNTSTITFNFAYILLLIGGFIVISVFR